MTDFKYKAFISYSHTDEQISSWLQHKLETFRVPSELVGAETAVGKVKAHLRPIFRDREDFPASGSLKAEIRAAIAASQYLIVVCSPAAAKSKWVNEEIKLFKSLHGQERVLAIIIDGEPWASLTPADIDRECFPPALRSYVNEYGALTDRTADPIAADARKDRDGKRGAFLKVVAGMLGVALNDLVNRDNARRVRRQRAISAVAGSIAIAMSALAVLAYQASREAATMRAEAEDLIDFMLTDLHEDLKSVGRLDVLDDVGERVLAYYRNRDARRLNPDELSKQARALTIIGSIEYDRRQLTAAMTAYRTAEETTKELLRRDPKNPERIFDHAQSVFYVGDVSMAMRDFPLTEKKFEEYLHYAEMLVSHDGDDPRWRLELAYATNNLGELNMQAGKYRTAIPFFEKSVAARRSLLAADPESTKLSSAYARALASLAQADRDAGDFLKAEAIFKEELAIHEKRLRDQENFRVLAETLTARRRLADVQLGAGKVSDAVETIDEALEVVDQLLNRDAENAVWRVSASHTWRRKSDLDRLNGDESAAYAAANEAISQARQAFSDNKRIGNAEQALGHALSRKLKVAPNAAVAEATATELARLLSNAIEDGDLEVTEFAAEASLALAEFESKRGQSDAARAYAEKGLSALTPHLDDLTARAQIALAALYAANDDISSAKKVINALGGLGVAHPNMSRLAEHLSD